MIFKHRVYLPFLFALLVPLASHAHNLDLSTLTPEQKTKLLKMIPKAQGSVTLAEMDAIVRALYLSKQFDAVAIYQSGGKYILDVQQTKTIGEIKLKGLSLVSEAEARKYLNIRIGEKFDPNSLAEAGDRLSQLYADRGYLATEISFAFPTLADGSVALEVDVAEKEPTKISSIKIDSRNSELSKSLGHRLQKHLGKILTEKTLAEINQDSRIYLNTQGYHRSELSTPATHLNIQKAEVSLVYEVPNANKFTFRFVGNQVVPSTKLKTQLDLKNYFTSTPNVASDLATRLRAYYLSEGFARADVRGSEEAGENDNSRVIVLTIDEGARIQIAKIEFSGRFSRSQKYYSDFIKTHSSPVIEKGYYNRDGLDQGYKNLVTELQNEGFLKAKVVSARNQFNENRTKVTVIVNIDEGSVTEMKDILFSGNEAFSAARLTDVLELKVGQPLRLSEIESKIRDLKNFYLENGFLEMVLLNERTDLIVYDESTTKATVQFKITEGPKVKVANIHIEGNDFTKDYVVHKEIEFKVGDTLTPSKITESINRLQKLGHFSSVDIRTLEEGTPTSERTVIIRLSERDPGILEFGAGATDEGSQGTIRGFTGIGYRNIGGTGRGVSSRIETQYNREIQYPQWNFTAGYLEPYLWDTRIRGRVNGVRKDVIANFETRRITRTDQVTFSLEQDITSNIVAVWDVWGIAQVSDFAASNKYKSKVEKTEQFIGTTGPYVDFDFRDHPFFPTKGTFSKIAMEYSSPALGSSAYIQYVQSTASFTHYLSWNWPGWVLANSVRGGVLENLSNETDGGVPYDKKGFFLGGASTIRGFGPNERFPDNDDIKAQYRLRHTANYYLFKSEIRFPIYEAFSGALFYDVGKVNIPENPLPFAVRQSIGFALRLNLVVPVNLEVGFKMPYYGSRDDKSYGYHLSIGTF